MDKDLLDKAVNALSIQGVFLHSANCRCKVVPPFLDTEVTLIPQHRGGPTGRFTIFENVVNADYGTRTVVFSFGAGTRLIDSEAAAKSSSAEVSDDFVIVEFTAEFCAHYSLPADLEVTELNAAFEEFGRHNVGYHVWPYWREHVQSMCGRMGLPTIPVPFYVVRHSPQVPK